MKLLTIIKKAGQQVLQAFARKLRCIDLSQGTCRANFSKAAST